MRVNAYILAADPAWIEPSVLSYYGAIDRLVVCYDRSHRSWTQTPIEVGECLERLQALDRDKKIQLLPGDFARGGFAPMENDSYQRQCALSVASKNADWVLQLDTDEVLPNAVDLVRRLAEEVPVDVAGVDWPMRVIYKQLSGDQFLEVCGWLRGQNSEYPGCAAVRSGARLSTCRFTERRRWRYDVRRYSIDPVSRRRAQVDAVVPKRDAIYHFSWARSDQDLMQKVRSWSHSGEFDGPKYVQEVWKPSPKRWPLMLNFHPLYPKRWPALRRTTVPRRILEASRECLAVQA